MKVLHKQDLKAYQQSQSNSGATVEELLAEAVSDLIGEAGIEAPGSVEQFLEALVDQIQNETDIEEKQQLI
jgi:hypothetical protein